MSQRYVLLIAGVALILISCTTTVEDETATDLSVFYGVWNVTDDIEDVIEAIRENGTGPWEITHDKDTSSFVCKPDYSDAYFFHVSDSFVGWSYFEDTVIAYDTLGYIHNSELVITDRSFYNDFNQTSFAFQGDVFAFTMTDYEGDSTAGWIYAVESEIFLHDRYTGVFPPPSWK